MEAAVRLRDGDARTRGAGCVVGEDGGTWGVVGPDGERERVLACAHGRGEHARVVEGARRGLGSPESSRMLVGGSDGASGIGDGLGDLLQQCLRGREWRGRC